MDKILYLWLKKNTAMMKISFLTFIILLSGYVNSQNWQAFTDSIPTLSSPRSCDLNNDGVKDIVIGGGTDGVASNNGIMAYNGVDGSLLWKRPARNEVFGSAIFKDITSDGINDVFIVGRSAQLLAINGSNGALLWDYFPYGTNPVDSGLYNFYNPQFIHDVDGDTYPDILVSNGGDHAAPAWQVNRPAGLLMVVSSLTGNLIVQDTVPDGAEIYCSPIVTDIQNNGNKWILFGTGGENFGGHFYAVLLSNLLAGDISGAIPLATDPNRGFIAPASIYKKNTGVYDIIIQSFGGQVTKISGDSLTPIWTFQKPGTESSAEPVIGNFTGDLTPDVSLVLFKGLAPSYNDFYQVMLDGSDGSVSYIDSLGAIHFASGNAVDLNNDGRDEAIFSITYFESGTFKSRIESFDFTTNTLTNLDQTRTGVTIGSTPLITDLDNDGLLDLIYSIKKDSVNVMGWKGIYVYRHELSSIEPNAGIAWGSYMGNGYNGIYTYEAVDCGFGSVISGVYVSNPTCNGVADGIINLGIVGGGTPNTFLWSTGSTSPNAQNLPAGNYWVQVTNSLGCVEYRTITLNDPFVISFGGIVPPTCIGDSNGMATLNSTGCYCMFSGCNFLWENGGTAKPNSELVEGWNSVIITHANGCVVIDSVFIPSPAPVVDSVIYQNVELCFGDQTGSAIVYYNQATQPVSFNWSNGMTEDTLTGLPAGDYYVIVQDGRPCRDSIAFTITQPDSLQFTATSTNVVCNGSNDGTITFTGSGGVAPLIYFYNGNGGLNNFVTGLLPDTYDLYVQDQNGCLTVNQSLVITEPPLLSLSITSSPASGPSSLDGIAEVFATGGTSPYSITWNDPNTQNGNMAVYLNPGWYTATVIDINGCAIEDSVFIGVLGMNEILNSELMFYPNPASDRIFVHEQTTELTLFDAKGAVVLHQKDPSTEVMIDLSPGMYTLELLADSHLKRYKLIVK